MSESKALYWTGSAGGATSLTIGPDGVPEYPDVAIESHTTHPAAADSVDAVRALFEEVLDGYSPSVGDSSRAAFRLRLDAALSRLEEPT